jgi:hypothetical protein
MAQYRVYTVGSDNHFVGAPEVIECADDVAAIKKAKELKNGLDVEVWERARVVARLTRDDRSR